MELYDNIHYHVLHKLTKNILDSDGIKKYAIIKIKYPEHKFPMYYYLTPEVETYCILNNIQYRLLNEII